MDNVLLGSPQLFIIVRILLAGNRRPSDFSTRSTIFNYYDNIDWTNKTEITETIASYARYDAQCGNFIKRLIPGLSSYSHIRLIFPFHFFCRFVQFYVQKKLSICSRSRKRKHLSTTSVHSGILCTFTVLKSSKCIRYSFCIIISFYFGQVFSLNKHLADSRMSALSHECDYLSTWYQFHFESRHNTDACGLQRSVTFDMIKI